MERTEFILINDSKATVNVFMTLAVSESYVSDINLIPFITKKINPFQGSFELAPQKFVYYKSPKGMVFGGKVSFDSMPINQPTPSYPNGINVAEFTLNNHQDYPKTFESIAINNQNGLNAQMKYTVNGGGTWTQRYDKSGKAVSIQSIMQETINNTGCTSFSFECSDIDAL